MRRWRQQLVVAICVVLGWSAAVVAVSTDPTMTNGVDYSVVESEIGASGCNPASGANFCGASGSYSLNPSIDDGGATLGEFASGFSTNGSSYSTGTGFTTTAQPGLMVTVSGTPAVLGILNTVAANTAISTFTVRDYTSSGYVVQIIGATPTYAGHSLTAMTSPATCATSYGCASVPGSEQFGLNVVANTSPTSVGANPVCQAAGFCFGVAGDGVTGTLGTTRPYTVDGKYRYVSGETVASGPSSSGETDYTITFLANQGPTTVAGAYTGNLAIVATGTY
jgi:hypothetical protein